MQGGLFLTRFRAFLHKLVQGLTWRKTAIIVLGAAICSFGIHNIHQRTGITEGGVLGAMLLVEHWLGISPAVITPILDAACYLLAFKYLGWAFIRTSVISTCSVSLFYKLWEQFPPMLPDLSGHPLAGAVLHYDNHRRIPSFRFSFSAAAFLQGGSSGGDDALALTISRLTHCRLSRAYLFTDLTVLGLSLTYIPISRIAFSLVTVTLSSFLIDRIQTFRVGGAQTDP